MFYRCFPVTLRRVPVSGGVASRLPGDVVRSVRSSRTSHHLEHCSIVQRFVTASLESNLYHCFQNHNGSNTSHQPGILSVYCNWKVGEIFAIIKNI